MMPEFENDSKLFKVIEQPSKDKQMVVTRKKHLIVEDRRKQLGKPDRKTQATGEKD